MNNEDFGKYLRDKRKEKGLTQKELATALNISEKIVKEWEEGKTFPSLSNFEGIVKTINVSIDKLLERVKESKNMEEQLVLTIVDLFQKEGKRKKNQKLLTIAIILFLLLGLGGLIWQLNRPKYSESHACVKEYLLGSEGIKGDVNTHKYFVLSPDFSICANQYGYAVFLDPDKAFKRLKKDYKAGIELIQKEFNLSNLTKNDFLSYANLGWQVTTGTEEEQDEAWFVSDFLNIYENSFDQETIDRMMK